MSSRPAAPTPPAAGGAALLGPQSCGRPSQGRLRASPPRKAATDSVLPGVLAQTRAWGGAGGKPSRDWPAGPGGGAAGRTLTMSLHKRERRVGGAPDRALPAWGRDAVKPVAGRAAGRAAGRPGGRRVS